MEAWANMGNWRHSRINRRRHSTILRTNAPRCSLEDLTHDPALRLLDREGTIRMLGALGIWGRSAMGFGLR